jgi:glycosyltransferase involved in cell wall biosynthesis
MKSAACTIIAKNYLPYARVLMQSLRRWAPEMRRFVILVDRADGYFVPANEDFEIILSEDLPIPQSRWFHFKYTILELSTAVKPFALELLFEKYGLDNVLYFDPDIKLYSHLRVVSSALESHNIALTPHLTGLLHDDRRPAELDILRSGAYNLGFIAVRRSAETQRFLKWWQARLYDQCVVDLAKGLFVDQRWIDLAPGLFDGVDVIRDPGYNVAYWNIGHRQITKGPQGYTVHGAPLCFFHFSGFDPENPSRFSRHQNRYSVDDLGDARPLIMDYAEDLLANGYADCRQWPYTFGVFENGSPIPDMGRPAHHESPAVLRSVDDPFSEEGYRAFLDLWNEPISRLDGKPSGVTRLAYRIYGARSDVQAAMPDIFGADLLRFLNWIISSGQVEHALDDAFVAPIWNAVRAMGRRSSAAQPRVLNEKVLAALAAGGNGVAAGQAGADIGEPNEFIENGAAGLRLSRLAKAIHESRPDLQRFFPDPSGRDGARFLLWFLTYGANEYRLDEALVSPLRQQWDAVVASLNSPVARLWYRCVLKGMGHSIHWRDKLNTIGKAWRYSKIRMPGPIRARRNTSAETAVLGLNIIGYLRSEMGIGESVRCSVKSARAAGVPVRLKSIDAGAQYRLKDLTAGDEDTHFPYAINLFHANADQSTAMLSQLGDGFTKGKYNIGFWHWELEEFPERWLASFDYFNEVWTPSAFCQDAIGRKSPVPVIRIPHAIHVEAPRALERSAFGIPEGSFKFLAIFDLLSVLERKNPLAIIEAFTRAFRAADTCHLVLKVNHARQRMDQYAKIVNACAGLPVTIIDQTIDRPDLNALVQRCDCIVSLHRSEGFGLPLAEAMYLGKPVIATAYSGNMDFTTAENAFLVRYKLVPVPPGCEPYDAGLLWAEPDLASAVEQMKTAYAYPELRAAKAAQGQDFVRRQLSPGAVGNLMKQRVELLARRLRLAHDSAGSSRSSVAHA